MTYSKEAELQALEGSLGYRFDLDSRLEDATKAHGVASSAHAFLGTSIRCILVGLHEPARELAQKARDWLQIAIGSSERPQRYVANGTEAIWYEDLATSNWIVAGVHDCESLDAFVLHQDEYFASSSYDRVAVSLSLVSYLDARAFSRVVALVDNSKAEGAKRAGETSVAYLVAKAEMGEGEVTRELLERFLRAEVKEWFARGHYLRYGRWMKVLAERLTCPPGPHDCLPVGLSYVGG